MTKIATVIAAGLLLASGAMAAEAAAGEGAKGGGFWSWGGGHGKGGHGGRGAGLMRLDADKDGVVTRDEFLSGRKAAFTELDTDKSGAVEPAEIRAPMSTRNEYWTKRMMKRLDANADGHVAKDEFEAGPVERFKERDLNSDGKITADERGGRRHGFWRWGKGRDGKDSDGKGRERREQTLEGLKERTESAFKELDQDGNGTIEPAEITSSGTRRADDHVKRAMHRQDKDNDGKVSEAEFLAKSIKRFTALDLDSDGKIGPTDLPPGGRKGPGGRQ